MQTSRRSNRRWIIARVWRGLPVEVEAYAEKHAATSRYRVLQDERKPEDEVALFELDLATDRAFALS